MLYAKIKWFDAGTRHILCKAINNLQLHILKLSSQMPVSAVFLAVCLILL